MKNMKYMVVLAFSALLMGACSTPSKLMDDDVYVSKNPVLSTTEEVNDVSSYENYRYRRDHGIFDTRYGRGGVFGSSIFFGSRFGNPFYDPFYDPFRSSYYNPFYNPYMCDPFYNYSCLGYYPGFYSPYGYYSPYSSYYGYDPYGYGFGYGYPNWYNNNTYNPGIPTGGLVSYNHHRGPRNSVSGVNNYGRNRSPETKGLLLNNQADRNFNTIDPSVKNTSRAQEISPSEKAPNSVERTGSEVKNSRPVNSGTALSRTGQTVRTNTTTTRNPDYRSGGNNTSTPTRDSGNYGRGNNSGGYTPARSSEPSGTPRNSGGTTTSPRNSGSGTGSGTGTGTRRGGN